MFFKNAIALFRCWKQIVVGTAVWPLRTVRTSTCSALDVTLALLLCCVLLWVHQNSVPTGHWELDVQKA